MTKSPVKRLSRREESVTLSSQTLRTKTSKKTVEFNSSGEDEIPEETTFPAPVATPTKRKSPVGKNVAVTPPKMRKNCENEIPSKPQTPSTILKKLSLNSPQKLNEFEQKNLFNNNQYQKARKALHSCVPTSMPGREKELTELRDFIYTCLERETSASLYISGPPGTGKTAALSKILEESQLSEMKKIFVNCTAIKSAGAIYARISSELNLKTNSRTEKGNLSAIENYLKKNRKMM